MKNFKNISGYPESINMSKMQSLENLCKNFAENLGAIPVLLPVIEKRELVAYKMSRCIRSGSFYLYLQYFIQKIDSSRFFWIQKYFLWSTFYSNYTFIHKNNSVGNIPSKVHFMCHDHHRDMDIRQ